MSVTRGSVYFIDFGARVGSVQQGVRPAVIISCNAGNHHSKTIIVAAITSNPRKRIDLPIHVRVENTKGIIPGAIVLTEQLMTVDKTQIVSYIGKLDETAMENVNNALKISVGID